MTSSIVRVNFSFNLEDFVSHTDWQVLQRWEPVFPFKKMDLEKIRLRKFEKEFIVPEILEERIEALQAEEESHALNINGFWTFWSQPSLMLAQWRAVPLILFPSVLESHVGLHYRIGIHFSQGDWHSVYFEKNRRGGLDAVLRARRLLSANMGVHRDSFFYVTIFK